MVSKIDKELAEKRKKIDGDLDHRISSCKGFWKVFIIHPATWAFIIIFCFSCYGIYHDWNLKQMIGSAFGYFITAILTGLIQHFITKDKKYPYE